MEKKNYIKTLFRSAALIIMLLIMNRLTAQQNSLFNTYIYDPMQLNIAYAGVPCSEANLHYRRQWISLKDAPLLYQLNAHTPLGKNTGLALEVSSLQIGLIDRLQFIVGYAYTVKLDRNTRLNFGLGAGFIQNSLDAQRATVLDAGDATLLGAGKQKAMGFDSELGIMLLGKEFKAGLALQHIYSTSISYNGGGYKVLPQINTNVSYIFNKGGNVEVEPWLVSRYIYTGSNTLDALLNVNFLNVLTLGAGYRTHYGMLFFLGVKTSHFKLGYSFDYGTSANKTLIGGSHQVMIGYGICKARSDMQSKGKKKKRYKSRSWF